MSKKLLSFLLFLILIFVIWPLFVPGFFTHHDNLQVIRVYEMKKCLLDLQIPCRWVPDMGYGYGFPLFNYYAPFAYYLGGLLSFVFGYITSVKILFLLTFILSFLGMYLLTKEFFGVWAAIFSSVLFTYAPYRALDVYVRGALAEIFAISLVPFIFYFVYKLSQKKEKKYFLGLVISLTSFFLSHNVMVMLFSPLIIIWMILVYLYKKGLDLKILLVSLFISLGVSSFFLLPAFFEKNLVQIESMTKDELNFRAHFVKVSQLFWDRSWHYSASNPQQEDTISFQIGWPHWFIVFLSLPFIIFYIVKKKKFDLGLLLSLFMFFVFVFSIFMIHNKSAFIWERIPILSFTQFPWRFLSLSIFSSSIIGGFFISRLAGLGVKNFRWFFIFMVLLTIFLNYRYFRPERFFKTSDKEMLSGESLRIMQKGSINDYLPVGALVPDSPAPLQVSSVDDSIVVSNFNRKTDSWSFLVKAEREGKVEVPVFNFPVWEVKSGNKFLNHETSDKGLVVVSLPRGEYTVEGKLVDTRVRRISNWISLLSLLLFVVFIRYEKAFKFFRS